MQLEQALLDNPDDPQAWRVYADWLEQAGDVWGRRLSLSLARTGAKRPERQRLGQAIDRLELVQRDALFGPLAPLVHDPALATAAQLERMHGLIVAVRLSTPARDRPPHLAPDAILRALLASPAARLLQRIELGLVALEHPITLQRGLDAIAAGGPLPAMRELVIGAYDDPGLEWVEVGRVADALATLPSLRALTLRGGGIDLGTALTHDSLEQLTIESAGLPAAAVEVVARAELPRLTHLTLWLGRAEYGGDARVEQLTPLLRGEGMPALRHLALNNAECQDDIALALVDSRVVDQLASVSLALGILTDRGGRALLDAADRLRHLERIDLDFNWLSAGMASALVQALPNVHIGRRNEPGLEDDDRYYTEVGE